MISFKKFQNNNLTNETIENWAIINNHKIKISVVLAKTVSDQELVIVQTINN